MPKRYGDRPLSNELKLESVKPGTKRCRACGIFKETAAFGPNRDYGDGLHYYCRGCMAAYHREHRRRNPRQAWLRRMRYRCKADYGITFEEYQRLAALQGGKCKICGASESGRKIGADLFVDHCHLTGQVRGLLCHHCNLILAHARDTEEILRKAITYLQEATTPK